MAWQPGRRTEPPPPLPQKQLAVFVKDARSARLIERRHPLGRELVCLMSSELLWSRTFKEGDDTGFDAEVTAACEAFVRRGWTAAE